MALRTLVILAACVVHYAAGDICDDGRFVGERFVDGFGYFGCQPARIAGSPVKVETIGDKAVQNIKGGRVVYSVMPGRDDKDPTTKGILPPCAVAMLECEPGFEPDQTVTELTCKNTSNEYESWWAFGVGAGGSFDVQFFEGCVRFQDGNDNVVPAAPPPEKTRLAEVIGGRLEQFYDNSATSVEKTFIQQLVRHIHAHIEEESS